MALWALNCVIVSISVVASQDLARSRNLDRLAEQNIVLGQSYEQSEPKANADKSETISRDAAGDLAKK